METKNRNDENKYLLLDSRNVPLAHVILEGRIEDKLLTVKITDNESEDIMEHQIYRLIGIGKNQPPIQCQSVSQKDRRIVLERIAVLEPSLRKDLRVPLHRKSFLYFQEGDKTVRREIEFVDISCGGTAFYGPEGLETVESPEIVLPVTAYPLIVSCEILNARKLRGEKAMYAAKFLNLCNDEETTIREAVFSVQIERRSRYNHL